jgi:hypothetical protein
MAAFPKLTILSDEHIPTPFPPTLGTELSTPHFLTFCLQTFHLLSIKFLYYFISFSLMYFIRVLIRTIVCFFNNNLHVSTLYILLLSTEYI